MVEPSEPSNTGRFLFSPVQSADTDTYTEGDGSPPSDSSELDTESEDEVSHATEFFDRYVNRGGTAFHKAWDDLMYIDGRIIEATPTTVTVDCLLDREAEEFEERVFDRGLFDGAVPVELGRFVIIRMQQRSGQYCLTVYDGQKRVNREPFETIEGLEQLEQFDYDAPYEEPNSW